jgi:hypothetical protein
MGFFDSLTDTSNYQAKALANNQMSAEGMPAANMPPAQGGLPPMQTMPTQQFAEGGIASAKDNVTQVQIMKVFEHYFKNLGVDVDKGMSDLRKEIDQGLQLIPFESSVMGYKDLGNNAAQIHFFTVGTLKDLTNDMQYFFKYLKDKGVKTVYDTLPAPITTQMLVKLGAAVEESDNPKYKLKATI